MQSGINNRKCGSKYDFIVVFVVSIKFYTHIIVFRWLRCAFVEHKKKINWIYIKLVLYSRTTKQLGLKYILFGLFFLSVSLNFSVCEFGSTERKITLLNSCLTRFFQIIRYYLVLLLTLTNVKQHTDIFKVTIFTRIVQRCCDVIIHNHRAIKLILKTIVWKGITVGFRAERMIGWKYQHVKGPKHHSFECSSHSRKSCL